MSVNVEANVFFEKFNIRAFVLNTLIGRDGNHGNTFQNRTFAAEMLTLVDCSELNLSVLSRRFVIGGLGHREFEESCIGATSANKVTQLKAENLFISFFLPC